MILTKFANQDEADLYKQACLTACSAIAMTCRLSRKTAEELCLKILVDADEEPTRQKEIDFERWKVSFQSRLNLDDETFYQLYQYFEGACGNVSGAWEDLRGEVNHE